MTQSTNKEPTVDFSTTLASQPIFPGLKLGILKIIALLSMLCLGEERTQTYTYISVFFLFLLLEYEKNRDYKGLLVWWSITTLLSLFSVSFLYTHSFIYSFFQLKNYVRLARKNNFVPSRDLPMSRDIFGFYSLGKLLLASSGWRPEMLLSNLQDSPTAKMYIAQNVSSARVRNLLYIYWK